MNLLQDVITYVRRIIKTASNSQTPDSLIIDYINRFWIMDVDARMQLFDLKTKYQFLTSPGVDKYNMPLYDIQIAEGNNEISFYPVYQGFMGPCFINGINVAFQTERAYFNNIWLNYVQTQMQVGIGTGSTGPYTFNIPVLSGNVPLINQPLSSALVRGHVDMSGIIATGTNVDPPIGADDGSTISRIPVASAIPAVYFTSTDEQGANVFVCDSGQFLEANRNHGLLMQQGNAPLGNLPLVLGPDPNYSTTQNTINYFTGVAENVWFPMAIPDGMPINCQCYYYTLGIPRSCLYYNNTIVLRSCPNTQYVVELDAYLSPAAFLSSGESLQFGYMAEYIARGAARKMLADTMDVEQFNFYEQLFKEQESLVWKRSQRQFTSTRSQTIYSQGIGGSSSYRGTGYGIGLQ